MNKIFKGYWIIGCKNQSQAEEGKGLLLWNSLKPNFFVRLMNRLLLNIRWVNKEREALKGDSFQTELNSNKVKRYKK